MYVYMYKYNKIKYIYNHKRDYLLYFLVALEWQNNVDYIMHIYPQNQLGLQCVK